MDEYEVSVEVMKEIEAICNLHENLGLVYRFEEEDDMDYVIN